MRREKTITILDSNRDQGKIFHITEMPALQAEKWAVRALLAMARSGIELPDGIEHAGLAGLATVSLRAMAGVSFTEAEPLMDEMLGCVTFQPDPKQPAFRRGLVETDIEEITTLVKLRAEALELHLGFSLDAVRSALAAASARTQAGT
jgi:hypothetical protein